jgi:hypothetical protein
MSLPILHPLARLADLPNRSRTDAPIPPATAVPPGAGPRRWLPAGIAVVHAAWMLAGPAGAQTAAPAPETRNEDPIALSPFVVSTTAETGYQATSTLAGTRLNTEPQGHRRRRLRLHPGISRGHRVTKLEDILTYTPRPRPGARTATSPASAGRTRPRCATIPSSVNRVRALARPPAPATSSPPTFPTDTFNFRVAHRQPRPECHPRRRRQCRRHHRCGPAQGHVQGQLPPRLPVQLLRLAPRGAASQQGHHPQAPRAVRLDLLNDETRFRQQPAYAQGSAPLCRAPTTACSRAAAGSFLGPRHLPRQS